MLDFTIRKSVRALLHLAFNTAAVQNS